MNRSDVLHKLGFSPFTIDLFLIMKIIIIATRYLAKRVNLIFEMIFITYNIYIYIYIERERETE